MRVKNIGRRKFLMVVVILFMIIMLYTMNYIATYNTYHFSGKLIVAISNGDVKKVEKILNNYPNGDVNTREYRTNLIPLMGESTNEYPIQVACRGGNIDIVKMLVDRGAMLDVVAGHDSSEMPLVFYSAGIGYGSSYSIDKNHLKITEYLIGQGMDPQAMTKQGDSVYKELSEFRDWDGLTEEEIDTIDKMMVLCR